MSDVHISFEVAGEETPLQAIGTVAVQLQFVLEDLERRVTGRDAHVNWRTEDQILVRAVASPNGTSETELLQVVSDAYESFRSVEQAGDGEVPWPSRLSPRGQSAIVKILDELNHVESMTFSFEDHGPVTLEHSMRMSISVDARSHREFSSIDGLLDLISIRGRPHFSMQEHGTGQRVRCVFPDEMISTVKAALGHRVVVEGLVHYRWDGAPLSVSGVTSLFIRQKSSKPLDEFIGCLPDFTGGIPPGDYIASMRGREDE